MKRFSKLVRALGLATAALLVILLAAALAVSAHGRYQLRSATALYEKQVGSLDPGAYNLGSVPVGENASTWITAGSIATELTPEEIKLLGRVSRHARGADWGEADTVAFTAMLERLEPALEILHRAAPLEQSNFHVNYRLDERIGRHEFLAIMRAARIMKSEARLALRNGDDDRFFLAAQTLSRIAVALEREPEFVALLIGITSEIALHDLIKEAITVRTIDQDLLTRFEELIPTFDLRAQLKTMIASTTARQMTDLHQWNDGPGGYLTGPATGAYLLETAMFATENLDRPFAEMLAEAPQPGMVTESILEAFTWARPMSGIRPIRPVRRNTVHSVARTQGTLALRNLTRLALRLASTRLETGAYPLSLDGLVESAEPDLFYHLEPTLTASADSSVILALAGGEEFWSTVTSNTAGEIPFRWSLP